MYASLESLLLQVSNVLDVRRFATYMYTSLFLPLLLLLLLLLLLRLTLDRVVKGHKKGGRKDRK